MSGTTDLQQKIDARRLKGDDPLTMDNIALLELYQRQDSMATQLWQHFLFANMAVVAVVFLITKQIPAETFNVWVVGPKPASWVLATPVLLIWGTFTLGGLSALRNSQDILQTFAHQIHGDIGPRALIFVENTRGKLGISVFHVFVDIGIFALCILMLPNS